MFTFYQAKHYSMMGKNIKAKGLFKKVLKVNPNHLGSILGLSEIYEEKKHYTKAQKLYEDYLSSVTDSKEVILKLIDNLNKQNKLTQTIPYLENLVLLSPDNLNYQFQFVRHSIHH